MDDQYSFDINLDFLDSSNIKQNVVPNAEFQRPSYDIELIASRIASVNDLALQLKAIKDDHAKLQKQMQDLSDSAMSIRTMYEREKTEKVKYSLLSNELKEKCEQAESQLANKTLHFEQLISKMEQSAEKGPIPYNELALRYHRLALQLDEDKLLHPKEKILLQQIQEYIEMKKLTSLVAFKKKCNLKVDTKDMRNQGTQYTRCTTTTSTNTLAISPPKEMKTQGTQYISSTTTRGTSTSTFFKTHSIGTNFPEVVPVSIEDIFKEMIFDMSPLSPICASPPEMSAEKFHRVEKVEMKSVGTNTGLKNVRKTIDYVMAKIKNSDSRPPSRNMFDRVKNETPFMGMPMMNPFSGLDINTPPMHSTVAELWNMLGHTIFALLQNGSGQLNPMHASLVNDRLRNMSADMNRRRDQQRASDEGQDFFEQERGYPPATRSTATSPISSMELGYGFDEIYINSAPTTSAFVPVVNNPPTEIQKIVLNKSSQQETLSHVQKKSSRVDSIMQLFPQDAHSLQKRKAIKELLKGSRIDRKLKKCETANRSVGESVAISTNLVDLFETSEEESALSDACQSELCQGEIDVKPLDSPKHLSLGYQSQSDEVFCKPFLPTKRSPPVSTIHNPYIRAEQKATCTPKENRLNAKRKRRAAKSEAKRASKFYKIDDSSEEPEMSPGLELQFNRTSSFSKSTAPPQSSSQSPKLQDESYPTFNGFSVSKQNPAHCSLSNFNESLKLGQQLNRENKSNFDETTAQNQETEFQLLNPSLIKKFLSPNKFIYDPNPCPDIQAASSKANEFRVPQERNSALHCRGTLDICGEFGIEAVNQNQLNPCEIVSTHQNRSLDSSEALNPTEIATLREGKSVFQSENACRLPPASPQYERIFGDQQSLHFNEFKIPDQATSPPKDRRNNLQTAKPSGLNEGEKKILAFGATNKIFEDNSSDKPSSESIISGIEEKDLEIKLNTSLWGSDSDSDESSTQDNPCNSEQNEAVIKSNLKQINAANEEDQPKKLQLQTTAVSSTSSSASIANPSIDCPQISLLQCNINDTLSSTNTSSNSDLSIDCPQSPPPNDKTLSLDLSLILKTPEKDNPLPQFKTPDSCTRNNSILSSVLTNSTQNLVEDFLSQSNSSDKPKFQFFLNKIMDEVAAPLSPISVLAPSEKLSTSETESSCEEEASQSHRKGKRKPPATAAIAVKRSARLKAKINVDTNAGRTLPLMNIPGIQLGKYTKRRTDLKIPLKKPKKEEAVEEEVAKVVDNICEARMGFFKDLMEEDDDCDSSAETLVIDDCPKETENSILDTGIFPQTPLFVGQILERSLEGSWQLIEPDPHITFDECPASPPSKDQVADEAHITHQCAESGQLMERSSNSSSVLAHIIANFNQNHHKMLVSSSQIDKQLLSRLELAIKEYLVGLALPMNSVRTVDTLLNLTTDKKAIAAALVSVAKAAPRPETEIPLPVPDLYRSQTLSKLLTLSEALFCQLPGLLERLQATIEQSLFTFAKDIIPLEVLMNLTQFYLAIIAEPTATSNPARLFICKCLYFYNHKATPMIYETLCEYPTVLPKRDDRTYDRSDALISAIQCILTSTFYDIEKTDLKTRQMLTKLRKFYNYESFKPPRDEFLDNLVAKIRAGRLKNVSYSFALVCKRMEQRNVEKTVLAERLLPLANEYYQTLAQMHENDERIACILKCISFVIKPFTMETDISSYINLFGRFLNASERQIIQEAALAALLRTIRFGYVNCFNAIYNFKPNYELTDETKAMLRSFVYKKRLDFLQRLEKQARLLVAT